MHHIDIAKELPMVQQIARSLARKAPDRIDVDELISAGSMGLVEAAARFSPERGVSFADFARSRARGAMLDFLRSTDPTSRAARRRLRELDRARELLSHRLKRQPNDEELAAFFETDLDAYYRERDRTTNLQLVSLESLGLSADAQERVVEALCCDDPSPAQRSAFKELRATLAEAISKLPHKQQLTLSLYYVEELRLREIGEILGVSESRVCQLHTAALRALRGLMEEAAV